MTEKAPISDFNFSPGSLELTPFDVSTLLQDYEDGRRKFNQIDLKNGNLSDVHLPYIHLEESLLHKADLRNAILAGASFNHTDLSSSNLSRINLIAADLIRAKLAGANLTGAFLSGANLSGANLRNSNLTDCTLAGANLSGVDFTGAVLRNTNMAGATLRGANLSTVDLSDIDLSELNLNGAILPANHGGASWTALQPGQPDDFPELTTQLDPGPGLDDTYPLDAFDDTYDELMQDLAEASDWQEAMDPEVEADTMVTADEGGAVFSPGSGVGVLGPGHTPGPEGSTGNPMALIPIAQDGSVDPDQVGDGGSLGPGITHLVPLDDTADDAAFTRLAADDAEVSNPPALDPAAGPANPASPQDTHHVSPVVPEEAPKEPPKEPYDVHQHPHQEEVVKSIQAVLNRRTHYSLQRKLLEVYGKRCAVTGCHLVPLLTTVLIDSGDGSVVDHPSNGLVLRSDIKTLYDLRLIAIHPTQLTVMLAPSLRNSSYGQFQGRKIYAPKQAIYRPGQAYLQAHLDHCKWSAYDPGETVSAATGPALLNLEPRDMEPGSDGFKADIFKSDIVKSGLLTKIALGAGGVMLGGLLMALLWWLLPQRPASDLADSSPNGSETVDGTAPLAVPMVEIDPDNRISLQLGPLFYPLGGVIYDDRAYLSMTQLDQAGLIGRMPGTGEVIRSYGQDFITVDYARALEVEADWNAETRTITLDCCSDPEVEPINIAINGQPIAAEGLIIEGSSYAPIDIFESLNLAQVQVSGENFVEVDQGLYVRASGLDPTGVEMTWRAATRTLNLEGRND